MKKELDILYDELWDMLNENQKDINDCKRSESGITDNIQDDFEYGMSLGWVEAMQFVIHKLDNIKKEEHEKR